MKNVIVLGAGGGIARHVIDILVKKENINLTLFLRNKSRLRNKDVGQATIIEGDVLNYNQLKEAVSGHDIVYANLAGELEEMAKNIVKAMQETSVKKIIFISSIGIYDSPVKSVLKPYQKAADVIEESGLEYTIRDLPGLQLWMKLIMKRHGKANRKEAQSFLRKAWRR